MEIQANTGRETVTTLYLDSIISVYRILTRCRFVHSITNHVSSFDHEEKGGGVLADEMGMGKSLSILSLVMRTLDVAQQWASSQPQEEEFSEIPRQCSRATLIIVSSARQFDPIIYAQRPGLIVYVCLQS